MLSHHRARRRGPRCIPLHPVGVIAIDLPQNSGLLFPKDSRSPPEMPHLGVQIGWRGQLPHLLPEPGPGFKIFVEGREEVGERRS